MAKSNLFMRALMFVKHKSALHYGLLITFALCMTRLPVIAQMDQGTITGTVSDSSGAVIPGAQVTLISNDTGFTLNTTSDGSGIYIFPPVKIGQYTITASAQGFKTTSQEHITLNIGQRLNVSLTLLPGEVSQTVTVSSLPPLLQTQSATVGEVLSTRTINNIPLNGRNWVFIAQLTAGALPSSGNSRGTGTGDFFANGQQAGQNNYILDGVDDSLYTLDDMNGSSYAVRPPPDALAEFSVDTSNYSAEFGHSAGSVINASTKSGTNQIHGDLWEYLRNDKFDAKDFNALTIPEYRENQFGATLGFPIIKNKLFFFGDNESNRIVNGQPTTVTVPTALMRQGNFSELLNTSLTGQAKPITLYEPNSGGTALLSCNGQQNVFCSSQIDKVAQNILNLYPMPNTNGGKTFNNYTANLKQTNNTWQWDTRADWNISAKDMAYTRFSYLHIYGFNPGPLGPILDGSPNFLSGNENFRVESYMFSETHIFSPTLTNEFRVGYNFGRFSFLQANYNNDIASTYGFGGIPFGAGFPNNGGLPYTNVSGINSFGAHAFDPSIEGQNSYQILDNVTKIVGNHALKFGVALEAIRLAMLQPTNSRGSYTFNGLYTSHLNQSFTGYGVADFLADQIDAAAISNESQFNDARWYRAGYAQDDWRVNHKLTVNLGLRYDFFQPFKENAGRQAAYHITGPLGVGSGAAVLEMPEQSQHIPLSSGFLSNLAKDNITLQYVSNQRLINSQFTNFAPRVGIAYTIGQHTVVRSGFGIFYGGLESVGGGPNFGFSYPFQYTNNYVAPNCVLNDCPSTGFTLEHGFSAQLSQGLAQSVSSPTLIGSDAEAKTPYAMDYNLTIQRSITNNIIANISYVGNMSRHLMVGADYNSAEALENPTNSIQPARPFPAFTGTHYTAYAGVSTYNALQTTLQKRYANGLNFLANYTWSHNLDDAPLILGGYGGQGNGGGFRNPNLIPIIDDYANSEVDTRQRFNFSGYYALPFGKDRPYVNHGGPISAVIGGWATTLVFSAETGQPIAISPNIRTAAGGTAFAILTGDPFAAGGAPNSSNPNVSCAQKTRTLKNWYNPCAFTNPAPGSSIPVSGTGSYVTGESQVISYLGSRRNQIDGPGYERIDMSFFKTFPIFHEQNLEFRADAFNLLNTPGYGNPSVLNDNSAGGQITAGRLEGSFMPNARFFQFALKYTF